MTIRIFIAGLLGAIAMFVWSSIAHVATPLGQAGISQIPNEAPVIAAMHTAMGEKSGLYFFPWVDMNAPDAMAKSAAAIAAHASGLVIYHPPGKGVSDMVLPMVVEFLKTLAITLIAAWLVSLTTITGFLCRTLFVTAIGVTMALSTNVSYWAWYGFPLSYTLAYIVIEVGEMLFAGLAIAWWLGRPVKA